MGCTPKPFQLKVYPNGEFAVHVQRKAAERPIEVLKRTDEQEQTLRAVGAHGVTAVRAHLGGDRKSTRLNSSHPV